MMAQDGGLPAHGDHELEDGCGCFRSLWPAGVRRIPGEEEHSNLLTQRRERKEIWVVTQFKKLRGVSELVAGPKWKNLVRKIGAYFNSKKKNDFQYDSFNYTLNFDNGIHNEDEQVNLGFSSRFAPPAHHDKPRLST